MTITQLWIYRHNSGVVISKHLNCVHMLIIQLYTYVLNSTVTI
nr:MAG TPA: hypothetical protein [Caudoviricetes sp.]DAR03223.1 MAG TPA: hypothetical protein [Caudoviricetes sp.]